MRKALLKVGYSCNSRCVFCHSEDLRRRGGDLSTAELEKRLAAAAAQGAQMAVFSGGEPTIRPDLPALARCAKGLGLKTGLITNGRRFVYPAFGRQLRALGLEYVYVSFHSHRAGVHDAVTRTRSFPQSLAALRHLAALGVELTVNTVVTRCNLADLDGVVDLLAELGTAKIKLSAVEPRGAALEDSSLVPPLPEAAAAIAAALRGGRRRHPALRFGCEGLTPCLLEDFDSLRDDLFTNGFTLFQEAFEEGFGVPDRANLAKPPSCRDCARFEDCPGVYAGYLDAGARFLKPLLRPRANSFALVAEGPLLPRPQAAPCAARGQGVRSLHLAEPGGMRACRTDSRDFSDQEIMSVRGQGQLYASARGRHRRLDYGRDLVKLRVSPLCAACAQRDGCSGLYERAPGEPFAALEAEAKGLVAGLRGDVLEVGCGAVRFRRVLEAKVRRGEVRYLGIDPELPRGRRSGLLRLRRVSLEDFMAADGSYDHVLLLRSYNHLRRPSELVPKLRRLLRPKGRLCVVDGMAFGLLLERRPAPAGRGDFEHFRNHDSGQARALLETFGFRTLRELASTPESGSEWLLELERA